MNTFQILKMFPWFVIINYVVAAARHIWKMKSLYQIIYERIRIPFLSYSLSNVDMYIKIMGQQNLIYIKRIGLLIRQTNFSSIYDGYIQSTH